MTQFNTVGAQQLSNHIRTFDTYFNNLRRDPTKNLDMSMLKRFSLERRYLQLRFESFNTTNRVTFSAPAQLNPTNSAFGLISSQANNSTQDPVRGAGGLVEEAPYQLRCGAGCRIVEL